MSSEEAPSDPRSRASLEAERCLTAAADFDFELDGFNLLGVVASPGTPSSHGPAAREEAPSAPSTSAAPSVQNAAMVQSRAERLVSDGDFYSHYLSDTVQTFESTLGQVAEQIDYLNRNLEDMSRHYLGDDDLDANPRLEDFLEAEEDDDGAKHESYYETIASYFGGSPAKKPAAAPRPQQQQQQQQRQSSDSLTPQYSRTLPPHLAKAMASGALQQYLERDGVLAHSFYANPLHVKSAAALEANVDDDELDAILTRAEEEEENGDEHHHHQQQQQDEHNATDIDIDPNESHEKNGEDCLEVLPKILIQNNFDLADPSTFMELLIQSRESQGVSTNAATIPDESKKEDAGDSDAATKPGYNASLHQPTRELVPVSTPESLSDHLDRVESALLRQVRLKSGAFFRETTRFSQLQHGIVELLDQTKKLRRRVRDTLESYGQVADLATVDVQRQSLIRLADALEAAMDVVRCKASVGGLLSANDFMGAAEQIHFGRQLWTGESHGDGEALLDMRPLAALDTSGAQLDEYQSLVVENLSEELVNMFLGFRNAPADPHVLKSMVDALELCGAWEQTGQVYERRLQALRRTTVRTTIVESLTEQDRGSVASMTYESFRNCLNLLLEELQAILTTAKAVDDFCVSGDIGVSGSQVEGADQNGEESKDGDNAPALAPTSDRWTKDAMASFAEQALKAIADLLRQRKEAHSALTLVEMKELWDTCLDFVSQVERISGVRAVGLRSTLSGQAKAFLDRTHETNIKNMAKALDSERWVQSEVSAERQAALTRLCTGRAVQSLAALRGVDENGTDSDANGSMERAPTAYVEGISYKVVWSCLLLVEIIMKYISSAAHFQTLASHVVVKVAEVLRLFNSKSTQLVLGAGAIHSAARLKNINAKHLSLVTQCLGMMLSLFPHIRAALSAQLSTRQHALLTDIDKIKREFVDHSEKVLNKFVTIMGNIVENGLAPKLSTIDFDQRATAIAAALAKQAPSQKTQNVPVPCCIFLEGVSTNTGKMHQVLSSVLPSEHLQDVFTRMFAYVDQKVPALLIAADAAGSKIHQSMINGGVNGQPKKQQGPTFHFPETEAGKRQMLLEIRTTTEKLNNLEGVLPWDFTALSVLERKLSYRLDGGASEAAPAKEEANGESETNGESSSEKESKQAQESTKDDGKQQSSKPVEDATPETEAQVENGEKVASPIESKGAPDEIKATEKADQTDQEKTGSESAEPNASSAKESPDSTEKVDESKPSLTGKEAPQSPPSTDASAPTEKVTPDAKTNGKPAPAETLSQEPPKPQQNGTSTK